MSFKFQFELSPIQLNLSVSFPCQVILIWKSSSMECQTQENIFVNDDIAIFNESLINKTQLKLEHATQLFNKKKTLLQVTLNTSQGIKQAGHIIIDLSEIVNQKKQEKIYVESLQKCPDTKAQLKFRLSVVYLEDSESCNSSKYSLQQDSQDFLYTDLYGSRSTRPLSTHQFFMQDSNILQRQLESEQESFTNYASQREIYKEKHEQLQIEQQNNLKLQNQNNYLKKINESRSQEIEILQYQKIEQENNLKQYEIKCKETEKDLALIGQQILINQKEIENKDQQIINLKKQIEQLEIINENQMDEIMIIQGSQIQRFNVSETLLQSLQYQLDELQKKNQIMQEKQKYTQVNLLNIKETFNIEKLNHLIDKLIDNFQINQQDSIQNVQEQIKITNRYFQFEKTNFELSNQYLNQLDATNKQNNL